MTIGSKGRGKSHGARVITVTVMVDVEETEINRLFIYDKIGHDNITIGEIKALIEEVGTRKLESSILAQSDPNNLTKRNSTLFGATDRISLC